MIEEEIMPTEIANRFGQKNESTVRNRVNKYNSNLLSLSDKQENI